MVTYSFHLYSRSSHHFILYNIIRKELDENLKETTKNLNESYSELHNVLLFIMLYKEVLTFEFDHSNKATEQYFPVVVFIMLHTVVLTFESVDGNRKV